VNLKAFDFKQSAVFPKLTQLVSQNWPQLPQIDTLTSRSLRRWRIGGSYSLSSSMPKLRAFAKTRSAIDMDNPTAVADLFRLNVFVSQGVALDS